MVVSRTTTFVLQTGQRNNATFMKVPTLVLSVALHTPHYLLPAHPLCAVRQKKTAEDNCSAYEGIALVKSSMTRYSTHVFSMSPACCMIFLNCGGFA